MATLNLLAMASSTPITVSSQLASGDNALVTCAANKAVKLVSPLVLCNTAAVVVTVSAGIIPSGGTVDGTHRILSGYSMAAGETIALDEFVNCWLGDGDKVNVTTSAATSVDATISTLVLA